MLNKVEVAAMLGKVCSRPLILSKRGAAGRLVMVIPLIYGRTIG
jgi:hypothetical protein